MSNISNEISRMRALAAKNRGNGAQESVSQEVSRMRGLVKQNTTPAQTPAVEKEEQRSIYDRLKDFVAAGREQAQPAAPTKTGDEFLDSYLGEISGNATAATRDTREGVNDVNYGKLAVGTARKGINQFAGGLTSTADMLLGQPLQAVGWKNNPISALNQEIKDEAAFLSSKYDENASKSVPARLIDKYGSATVAAIPRAALALYSGGASLGAQATTKGLQAASGAASKASSLGNTISTAIDGMARSPQYWMAFLQTAGNGYEQAKADGMDELHASTYGMTNGLVNALIEVGGGGIQELPAQLRTGNPNAIRAWVNTMLDEGKEEVVQGIMERGLQNLVYAKRNPLYSTEDENAIINPRVIGEDALGGAVVGGILGGGQALVNNAIQRKAGTPSQLTDVPLPRRDVQNVSALDVPAGESIAPGEGSFNDYYDISVGAAKPAAGKQVESNSKAILENKWMDDAAKASIDPITHERVSEEMSLRRAGARIARDSEGNIVNFNETVDDLLSLPHWGGEDSDLAQLLAQEAAKRGDADAFAALTSRYIETGTENAQALQARKKWVAESPENIIAESLDALSGADSKTANDAYAAVTALSEEFGKAKTAEDYIKIIRDTAKTRRTAGLFSKSQELSRFSNWALGRVLKNGDTEFLRSLAANGIVAIADDTNKTGIADGALSIRRLSMLSKPATFFRNLFSTGVFDLVESGTQNMAALLDSGVSRITGTRSVPADKSWGNAERRKAAADALAKSFLEVALDVDTQGFEGRYGSSANRAFHMSGNPAARLFSTLEKYMGYSLTTSDALFRGGAEAGVMSGLQELADLGLIKEATPGAKKNKSKGVTLADNAAEKFMPGTLVKALDRNNYGRVVDYNSEDDSYIVHFVSHTGHQADVRLPADQVTRAVTAFNAKRSAADVKPQTVEEMIAEMAADEAAYRTFHNDSGLSKVSGLIQKAGNVFHLGNLGAGDLAIPFAKTPSNVVSAIFDYSPFGLARGAYQLADVLLAARNGGINPKAQAEAVRNLARSLSGTALILIAKAAAEEGIITVLGDGKDDEDADALALEKMAGIKGVQLNVNALARRVLNGESGGNQDGDFLLALDAFEPFGAHFAIGAMIADDITPEMNGWGKLGTFAEDSAYGALSYLSDMPVASPFSDAVNDFIYSDGATVGEKLGDAALGFAAGIPSSFVPNIVKGIAQGTDAYQRDAYSSETRAGEIADTVKAGLPGLRQTLPVKLDSYGQPMENDSKALNFLNSTVLPGAVTRYEKPTAYDMLMEAYEAGRGAGVLPERKAPNSITVDNEDIKLNADAKSTWQQAAGQRHEKLLAATENNEAFSALPADTQAEVLKDLRTSAAWDGKTAIGYGDSLSEKEKAIAALGSGDWVSYFAFMGAYNEAADEDATANDMDTLENLLDIPMTDSVAKVIMDGDFAQMYKLTNAGVSVQDYFDYRAAIGNIKVAPGYSNKPNWQKFNAIGGLDADDTTKLTLISDLSESTGKKIKAAYNRGVSLDAAIDFYAAISARNEDGTDKNAAQKNAAVAALNLPQEVVGILNSALR